MSWNNVVPVIVSGGLYGLLLAGIGTVLLQDLEMARQRFRLRRRLLARKRCSEKEAGWRKHLDSLFAHRTDPRKSSAGFLAVSFLAAGAVLIPGLLSFRIPQAAILAAAAEISPYLLVRTRFEVRKRRGSYEGEAFVGNLISQYRLSSFNLFDALEKLLREHPVTRVMNRLTARLLMELRTLTRPEEIRQACHRFAAAAGTNWAAMLSYSLGQAAETGINISSALEDVLIQMREARQLIEERRRLNGEAIRIVVYLIPGIFGGGMLVAVRGMGLGWRAYFHNQFMTPQGFFLFLLALFLLMLNIALIEAVSNRRFDF